MYNKTTTDGWRRYRVWWAASLYCVSVAVSNILLSLLLPHFGVAALGIVSFTVVSVTFTLRDILHREWEGHAWWRMLLLILAGAVCAGVTTQGARTIAIASFTAFAVSEAADAVVYATLGTVWQRKAFVSNIVSAVLDSCIFLLLIGAFASLPLVIQVGAKLSATYILIHLYARSGHAFLSVQKSR